MLNSFGKVCHSIGDNKNVKTYWQCMSLMEKTEFLFFFFFLFPYFRVLPMGADNRSVDVGCQGHSCPHHLLSIHAETDCLQWLTGTSCFIRTTTTMCKKFEFAEFRIKHEDYHMKEWNLILKTLDKSQFRINHVRIKRRLFSWRFLPFVWFVCVYWKCCIVAHVYQVEEKRCWQQFSCVLTKYKTSGTEVFFCNWIHFFSQNDLRQGRHR